MAGSSGWVLLLLDLPALRTLFASISRIDVTHAQCLTITLHRRCRSCAVSTASPLCQHSVERI
jgi:MarR-like DNA-binding transcriptional regulator SgrR of sgrS sRNA